MKQSKHLWCEDYQWQPLFEWRVLHCLALVEVGVNLANIVISSTERKKKVGAPISCSSVPLSLVVGVAFAVLSDVSSAPLLCGFLLTSSPSLLTLNLNSAFSFQRGFGGESFAARICSHLLCLVMCVICMGNCSWFTDRMNKHISPSWIKHQSAAWLSAAKSMLPGNRKCSMMVMLYDLIDGHQAICSKKERKMGHPICSWLRPLALHVLRKARARRDYKLSSFGIIFLNTVPTCQTLEMRKIATHKFLDFYIKKRDLTNGI